MIAARGLIKRYGSTLAVNDLSFTIRPGMVTGFLGPNGAGKTTTMRLILGLDYPTEGTVTVNGTPYAELASPMHEVGALLDARAVHGGRSAHNHLLCLAQTNDIPRRRVDEVLGIVGLSDVARKRSKGFSLGMSQRLGDRRRAARRSGDPDVRRAGERARPRGHPVDPHPDAVAGRRGPHGAGVQPPDVGDGEHRRPSSGRRARQAHRGLRHGRVHRPQLRPARPGADAAARRAGQGGHGRRRQRAGSWTGWRGRG